MTALTELSPILKDEYCTECGDQLCYFEDTKCISCEVTEDEYVAARFEDYEDL